MKKIIVYKTHEISEDQWQIILAGFNECFPEHTKQKEEFISRYTDNPVGYCYHALYYENGAFAAFNSITPYVYMIDGREVVLGLSGDTYVLPQYRRNMLIFMETYNKLKEVCAGDGVVAFLGVPNPNSYQYSIKLLKCKEISKVAFWILPVRLGNILGRYKFLNMISLIYAWVSLVLNFLISCIINTMEQEKRIHIKIDKRILETRLSAKRYVNVNKEEVFFSYTVTNDEGIRCAYIMFFGELYKRSYRSLVKCVNYILNHEEVDLIMFNGTLNLHQILLLKTPEKFEPRKLPFTVNLTSKTYYEDYSFLFNPNNWDFTLFNLDVR